MLWGRQSHSKDGPNQQFENYLTEALTQYDGKEREDRLMNALKLPYFQIAHPRTEHLIPFFVVAALSEAKAKKVHEEWAMGELSLSSFQFD
jgi:aromatic ring-opening dioxygenase catalytic subunit (LigB family)